MGRYRNLDEVKEAVETSGDVLTVEMGQLRDAVGYEKLGIYVIREIEKGLEELGIGYDPEELPGYQEGEVRLYRRGTLAAAIIKAVYTLGRDSDHQIGYAAFAQATYEQIKTLIPQDEQ
ncbi:MAG: hypothetical protein IH955_04955 [Chloroflexi bacterium]|nr:hypothetical protein [Chloroflexota bacterium]